MKISREQYEAAYQVGLEFHRKDGKLGIAEAKRRLIPTGLNANSAADLVYDVGHLLRGECYKRAMSEAATDDYLTWIRHDCKIEALRNALTSLELHIDYRRKKKSSDQCQGLVRLLNKHRALLTAVNESSFVLEWRDEESAGLMDWLPLSWFAEEGVAKKLSHPVGEDGRPQGQAYCDLIVQGETAELDYRPYSKLNAPNEVLHGVLRLTFADADRTSIAAVVWKAANEAEIAPADFRQYAAPKTPRLVRDRKGQAKFRRTLKLVYGNRCCISGCTVPAVLEGAHIDPYQSDASDHIQNGLLLRADLHTLFDRHLIAIDPETLLVHVAKSARAAAGYEPWHRVPLQVPTEPTHHPDQKALLRHWQSWRDE